ncbi:MAG TPA: hypothetical protein VGO93_18265 [Candidatus Xenobia bacterium]
MKRAWILMLLVLALASGGWADELTPGGTVSVDGHTLAHHFALKGHAYYFPVEDMAQALGKTAQVQGDTVVWDGKAPVPVMTFQGVAYAEYHSFADWLPGIQFGVTSDGSRAVFSTHPATAHHAGTPATGSNTNAEPISTVSTNMLPDSNRGGKMTIEATFMNNTKVTITGVKVQLLIVDVGGVTGQEEGKPVVYAAYDQTLGDLLPGAGRKATFETDILDPQNIDSVSKTFSVQVIGKDMTTQTTVPLTCQFRLSADKPQH